MYNVFFAAKRFLQEEADVSDTFQIRLVDWENKIFKILLFT